MNYITIIYMHVTFFWRYMAWSCRRSRGRPSREQLECGLLMVLQPLESIYIYVNKDHSQQDWEKCAVSEKWVWDDIYRCWVYIAASFHTYLKLQTNIYCLNMIKPSMNIEWEFFPNFPLPFLAQARPGQVTFLDCHPQFPNVFTSLLFGNFESYVTLFI